MPRAQDVSARERLAAAAVAALAGVEGLAVFDAPPPARAALPHAVVDEPELRWAPAAALDGWEGRLTASIRDAGERPARLRDLGAKAEAALAAMPAEIGGGWRLARMRLIRGRVIPDKGGGWRWTGDYEVRLYRPA